MSLLEDYLVELRDIRASGAGVAETSYYTPLANLLNEVGKALKPRVRCILQLANRGAGQPLGERRWHPPGLAPGATARRPGSPGSLGQPGEAGGALLDTEHPELGVTAGAIRPELQLVGAISREGGGHLQESDLAVTAGWGHAGQKGVVMPGRGKLVERDYSPEELAAIRAGAEQLGFSLETTLAQLGERTCGVYLNDMDYWRNVPAAVWEYVIGGYQVMKKWLSYREQPLLGRALTSAEVREVQAMARRIAAILLLQPALDANYRAVNATTCPWPTAL